MKAHDVKKEQPGPCGKFSGLNIGMHSSNLSWTPTTVILFLWFCSIAAGK
jgi:hypothetical protein